MLEVELWDYHLHTHFSSVHGFKKVFNFYFQLRFRVNMFLENSLSFGKTFFGKTSFIKEDIYQNVFNLLE